MDLPAVLFSGEFSSRSDDKISEHSGLIVLDFDHVEVEPTKKALAIDDYVYACWVSPSANGIKALVRVSNPERHRDHFRALVKYFDTQYGLDLDSSGINESRACFESYDPEIIVKEGSKKFGNFLSQEAFDAPPVTPIQTLTDYTKLNVAVRMIRNATEGEKHNTLIKAATLCGGYIAAGRLEEEEVCRVLLREIVKRDIESPEAAKETIRKGVDHGKTLPIRDVVNQEQDHERKMRIQDGDMSFISSDSDDYKWIDDFSQGRIDQGLDTGSTLLDEHFKYKKELVIMNGHSNVGKTTTALYFMVNSSVRHGWKWMVYSAENRTASIKMSLMQFVANKRVGNMSYTERKNSYEWVKEHFIVINNAEVYSYVDIILFMEKVIHYKKIDAVFIDPYNALRLDMRSSEMKNTHDYHYEAATSFLTFSNNHNIAVWLNMHAVTEAQRLKGADGLPRAPFAEDTEGGGKFVNRADGFLTIHRKVQATDPHTRNMTEIHVRKVREVETGGRPTPLAEPFKITMNLAHTGFMEWGKSTPIITPIDFNKQAVQKQIAYNSIKFTPQDFLKGKSDIILPSDEEKKNGNSAFEEEEPGSV
tara:strand:+ start:2961 stop:4730 length:1770 start_codon:yes stop_codon:yes gene_type:complete